MPELEMDTEQEKRQRLAHYVELLKPMFLQFLQLLKLAHDLAFEPSSKLEPRTSRAKVRDCEDMLYHFLDETPRSTGFRVSQMARATIWLGEQIAERVKKLPGMFSGPEEPICNMVERWMANNEMGPFESDDPVACKEYKRKREALNTRKAHLRYALIFFKGMPLSAAYGSAMTEFISWMQGHNSFQEERVGKPPVRSRKQRLSKPTAELVALDLQLALREDAAAHNAPIAPFKRIKRTRNKRYEALSVQQFVRLMFSALFGWTWDNERDRWRLFEFTDPVTGDTRHARVLPDSCYSRRDLANHRKRRKTERRLGRLMMIAVFCAIRLERNIELGYHKRPDRGHVEFGEVTYRDEVIDGARIHRKGEREVQSKKRAYTTVCIDRLAKLLNIFRQEDLKKLKRLPDYVVHDGAGGKIGNPHKAFRRIADRAGLSRRVGLHTLKHTSITWLCAAGWSPAEVADWSSTSMKECVETYTHALYAVEVQRSWARIAHRMTVGAKTPGEIERAHFKVIAGGKESHRPPVALPDTVVDLEAA